MGEENTQGASPRYSGDALRLILGFGLLGISAVLASRRGVEPLEGQTFRFINRLPSQGAMPLRIIMQAGALGSSFAAAGLALVTGQRRLARDLVSSGTMAWLLAKAAKAIVARERPAQLLSDVRVHGQSHTGLGFPSGHAAVSAALATAAVPYLPQWGRRISWGIAGLVSLARIYVGAHLPVDIIGGVPLGIAAAAAVRFLWAALGVDPSTKDRDAAL